MAAAILLGGCTNGGANCFQRLEVSFKLAATSGRRERLALRGQLHGNVCL